MKLNDFPQALRVWPFSIGRFATALAILFYALAAAAQATNGLSDAETQGWQLARTLCNSAPTENLTNNGVLDIRPRDGEISRIPITFESRVTATNWSDIYEATRANTTETLLVVHAANQSNVYFDDTNNLNQAPFLNGIPILGHLFRSPKRLSNAEIMVPFAGSDFWIADLGLEFFHWPGQKIVKREFMRGRACTVLESANPNPSANGYSRVDSWIDEETLGIVHAQAYDANGKLLKVFDPKSFKKVNGQWELQDMEIRNVQTGSRTRIEFDLKPD
jgi:hypothetical protein